MCYLQGESSSCGGVEKRQQAEWQDGRASKHTARYQCSTQQRYQHTAKRTALPVRRQQQLWQREEDAVGEEAGWQARSHVAQLLVTLVNL